MSLRNSIADEGGPPRPSERNVASEEHIRAILNILEDFSEERASLQSAQNAILNMLEDSSQERTRFEEAQKAILNMLEDFGSEKGHLELGQKAILNILEDLATERSRLESASNALRDHGRQLETLNQELEAFNYAVAHGLRAPLRSLEGFSLILVEDYGSKLDDEGHQHLQRIRRSAIRMGTLIDDMLRLSRVGRQPFRRERVNLSRIALSISEELSNSDRGRTADFLICPDLETEGDSSLITVALRNLLENAWKYSARRNPARIEFGASPAFDGSRVFFVRDDGCGFDMAYAGKLFAPFQRLHRAEEFEGSGIGLATVKRVVSRHGGRAWIESVVDRGTTAYFTLEGTGADATWNRR